jgi:alpha-1,4-digalacturonate transport system substrate-binding protein
MDYLASEPVYEEYHARTLFLTASAGLSAKGIPYKTDLPQVQKSLTGASENVKLLSPIAYTLQGYRYNRILFNAMIVRLNQAIAGEMSLADALARMSQDLEDGLKAQGVK